MKIRKKTIFHIGAIYDPDIMKMELQARFFRTDHFELDKEPSTYISHILFIYLFIQK